MKIFVIALCSYMGCVFTAFADSFIGDELGHEVNLKNDTIIHDNVWFKPSIVNINMPIELLNHGYVDTEFVVCSHCEVKIKNYGDFKADFDLGTGATVVQVVSDVMDLKPIVTNVKYTLLIDGVNGIELGGLLNPGVLNAIVINDSVVDINNFDFIDVTGLELHGDVVFVTNDLSDLYDVAINNVTGDASVRFQTDNTDPMYSDVGYIENNQLVVKRVRETDYVKVLNSDTGVFLNALRIVNPNDMLLKSLDAVTDLDDLYDVMARSVRFNPDLLLQSVRIINAFDGFELDNKAGTHAKVDFVYSDNFYSYAAKMGIVLDVADVNLGAEFRVGNINYESDLDSFMGVHYGARVYANYVMENNWWLRGDIHVTKLDSDIGGVFYDNHVINNPSVLLINGIADLGYRYKTHDLFYVAPFVGVVASKYLIEGLSGTDVCLRSGVGLGYENDMWGIKYNYDVRIGANSDDGIDGAVRIGFWSEYDMLGGDAEFGVVRMFDTVSYRVSITGRVQF